MTEQTTEPTGEQILAVPMGDNDALATTIREYLTALLRGVWRETEAFDGKRPFGNSGWWHELYTALAAAGLVESSTDEWGDVEIHDTGSADALIERAIDALTHPIRPDACQHDYHDVRLSPEHALIRITVSACRLCGQPEPTRRDDAR
jgi:hypothetical protein